MANTLKGAGTRFLAVLDFNSAIAACDAAIESAKDAKKKSPGADDYLCRGYAHCFVKEKDDAHLDKAIADCSMALHLRKINYPNNAATAYRVRALAHYLKGDYANALADCNAVLRHSPDTDDKAFAMELRAKINRDTGRYIEAIKDCSRLLKRKSNIPNIFPNTALAETYRESCKRVKAT